MLFRSVFDTFRRDVSFDLFSADYSFRLDLVRDFLYSQGVSSDILRIIVQRSYDIPTQSVPYSFGSLANYFSNNLITRAIFNTELIREHTIQRAISGASLGSTLAYLEYPITYLRGVGMGSSYVAELFVDFSYLGLIIGNLGISYTLFKIPKMMLDRKSTRLNSSH